jgi:hypothetical protein
MIVNLTEDSHPLHWALGYRTGLMVNGELVACYPWEPEQEDYYLLANGKVTNNLTLARAFGDFEIVPSATGKDVS